MTTKHSAGDVATWLLQGAKDLVWQDDPLQRKPSSSVGVHSVPAAAGGAVTDTAVVPSAGTAAASNNVVAGAAQRSAQKNDPAANAMSADLLALVMNRPTAYSALNEAIVALGDLAMDDTTRTRAAFAVLKKTQQRSVDQVVQAIDIHLGLLEAERSRFASQSRQAEEGGVTGRAAQVAGLAQRVQTIDERMTKLRSDTEAQLAQMQQEQQQKQQEAQALTAQIEAEKLRIERTTQAFSQAALCVEQWLHRERATLRQRLAGET